MSDGTLEYLEDKTEGKLGRNVVWHKSVTPPRQNRRVRPTCSIPGCDAQSKARGFCPKHYELWRRNGVPVQQHKPSALERFWAKVDKSEDDDCWLWTGAVSEGGYPNFWDGKRYRRAHQFSYESFVGSIPQGFQIDHTCHKIETCDGGPSCLHRRCVNPSHLTATEPRDNVLRGHGPPAQNARKTRCPKGHEYTYFYESGRECRECIVEARRQRKQKHCG